MSAPANSPVSPGQVLAGKYRVERVLGQGGMGIVVAATHLQLGERVALKFLLKDATAHPEIVARFLREAQAAVRIKSEHVARIIDVGTLDGGEPFMVMEFLSGRDLSQILETRGPLPSDVAIEYVLQACEAIAEAHALGIVHRDLKPANLFVTRRADGSHVVKVLDFGISKATALEGANNGASLTATTGGVMGSPLYMSPEQVRSAKKVDPRADIWSLGVILHELMTDETPFMAETMPALLAAIMVDEPLRLREHLPTAPPALEAVVLRCLDKDLSRRFANVADLAVALSPFAPNARVSVDRISRVLRNALIGGTVSASSDPFDAPAVPDTFPMDLTVDPSTTFDPPSRLGGTLPLTGPGSRAGSRPSLEPYPTLHAGAAPALLPRTETARGWGQTNPESIAGVTKPSAARGVVVAFAALLALAAVGVLFARGGGSAPGATAPASLTAPSPTLPPSATVAAPTSASVTPPAESAEAKPGRVAPVEAPPTKGKPGRKGGAGGTAVPPPSAPPAAPPPAGTPPTPPGRGDYLSGSRPPCDRASSGIGSNPLLALQR